MHRSIARHGKNIRLGSAPAGRPRHAAVDSLAACSSTALTDVEDPAAGHPSRPVQAIAPYTPAGCDGFVAA